MDDDSDVPRKIAEVLIRKVPDDQQVSVKTWYFSDVLLLSLLKSILIPYYSFFYS